MSGSPATQPVDHIEHPAPAQYWAIALILAIITGAEVASTALPDGAAFVIVLLTLMAVKFYAVVAFFMHLRFDKPLFRNFFLIGLVGATAMYLVVLLTFTAF